MNKAVFLDCASLRNFSLNNPLQTLHQEVVKGVNEGLDEHTRHGYKLIGIENQEVDHHCEIENIITQYRLTAFAASSTKRNLLLPRPSGVNLLACDSKWSIQDFKSLSCRRVYSSRAIQV